MAGKNEGRALVLAAAAVTGSFAGAIYMWSIFNQPLIDAFGWDIRQVSLAYSVYLCTGCISGFFAGWLQQRMKSSLLVLCAGTLFSLGWFLTGFATTVPMLFLTFSIIGGFGDGIVYNTAVATATRWFPDKRGFANGVCVGCMGLSALVFAPLGNFFIAQFGPSGSFRLCGLVFLAFFWVFSWFVKAPNPGWVPEGWEDGRASSGAQSVSPVCDDAAASTALEPSGMLQGGAVDAACAAGAGTAAQTRGGAPASSCERRSAGEAGFGELATRAMLKTAVFWVIWLVFVLATSSGMMMTAHASNIGQDLVGMTASQGALMVSILAVGNFCGRFGFGWLSDIVGRYNTLALMMAITGCDMILLFGHASSFASFMVALVVVGACFGGTMSVVPSLCADLFGNANFGMNYAALYTGYTAAAFLGPMLAAGIFSATGSYVLAFTVAGLLAFGSIVLVVVGWALARRARRDCTVTDA